MTFHSRSQKSVVKNLQENVKKFLESRFEKIKILQQTDKSGVWLAQERATKKLVVIKFLNSIGLPYQSLKKISHPLWAKIFYCAQDSADTVIVEEFLQGESLAEMIEQKKFLSDAQARKILLQMCDGLKILHENKIIHRDIKPSNLILQTGEIIRLIDFDAARIFNAEKKVDTHSLGTKGYAPPEQFGYGQTDNRSDIFSLGVTIFEILGDNCGNRLKKILLKCTELDPKNRFQSVDELKAALLEKPRTSHKKIFVCGLLVIGIIGILLFVNSTSKENFPAEAEKNSEIVDEEKISVDMKEVEKIEKVENKNSPPEKKFKFPEIKFPEEVERSQGEKVERVFELPQITFPEKISPPTEKNPEPEEVQPIKNYVKVKYWLNGTRSAEWTDNFESDTTNAVHSVYISENSWSRWQSTGGGSIIFPGGNYIYIEAQNFSSQIFTDPQVNLVYNDNGRVETKTFYGNSSIAPGGGKISFSIPLEDFRVDNPRVVGDNWMSRNSFEIYFSGGGAEIIGSKMTYDFGFISQKRWDEEKNNR